MKMENFEVNLEIKEEPVDIYEDDPFSGSGPSSRTDDSGNVTIKDELFDDMVDPLSPLHIVDERANIITVHASDLSYNDHLLRTDIPIEDNQIKHRTNSTDQELGPQSKQSIDLHAIFLPHLTHAYRNGKIYKCDMCKKLFGYKIELNSHIGLHRLNKFFCIKNCGYHFQNLDECLEHEFQEHKIKNICCNVCNNNFSTSTAYLNHMRTFHKNLPRFNCSFCRLWFLSSNELLEHWRHTPQKCGSLFQNLKPQKTSSLPLFNEKFAMLNKSQINITNEIEVKQEPLDDNDSEFTNCTELDGEMEIKTEIETDIEIKTEPILNLDLDSMETNIPQTITTKTIEPHKDQDLSPKKFPKITIVKAPVPSTNANDSNVSPNRLVKNRPVRIHELQSNKTVGTVLPTPKASPTKSTEGNSVLSTGTPSAVKVNLMKRISPELKTNKANACSNAGSTSACFSTNGSQVIVSLNSANVKIDEEEFRKLIADAAERGIEEAKRKRILPNAPNVTTTTTEDNVIAAMPPNIKLRKFDKADNSNEKKSIRSLNQPTVTESSSPTDKTLKLVIAKDAQITLSLDSIDSYATMPEEKLKTIIAKLAEAAIKEAKRKHAFSRTSMGEFENSPDKRKIIDNIVRQIKLAEMGISSQDISSLPNSLVGKIINESDAQSIPKNDTNNSVKIISENNTPKSEYVPIHTNFDPVYTAMQQVYSEYRFEWLCPCCSKPFETKHAMRSHLIYSHSMNTETFEKLKVQIKPVLKSVSDNNLATTITTTTTTTTTTTEDNNIINTKVVKLRSASTAKKGKYQCEKCDRLCSSKSMLMDHIRGNCSREPQYTCSQCSKKFFSASTLACHMSIHTGELPHKCDYCEKRFRTRGQVTVHHRTHTGERPFHCEVCSQSFTHRETLISHLSRHIGMKRYKCYGCNKLFSCISGLRTHREIRPSTCGKVKLNSRAVGPRVRVIRGNVIFEPQPDINPYLRTEDPQEVLAEIQNQPNSS